MASTQIKSHRRRNINVIARNTPADFPAVLHWLDVDNGLIDSGDEFPADGDEIKEWVNRVGTQNPVQSSSSRYPTYDIDAFGAGHPGIRFTTDRSTSNYEALDVMVSPTVAVPYTQFIVVKLDDVGADTMAITGDWGEGVIRYQVTNNKWLITSGSNLSSSSIATANATLLTVTINGGSDSTIAINGVVDVTGNGGATDFDRLVLGWEPQYNNSFLDGWLGDFVVARNILARDRDKIEDYLGDKFGITITH